MRIKSSQARKQRLTVYEMPSHHRKKLVSVTLSKDLRKEIGARNIVIRKGDTIKVLRGSHRDKKGVAKQGFVDGRFYHPSVTNTHQGR